MTQNEFLNELKKLNINLTEEKQEKLATYANYLIEYNLHTNLTSITNIKDIYLKHFYDSLTLTKIADFKEQSLLDIGSGAGFPGLVLAIVYPNLKVTLLDSNNKKITFLKECIKKLNITNVTIIYDRAEDYAKANIDKFDYVTSRAVAELRILIELGIPCLKVKGHLLVMKANLTPEEMNNSLGALTKLSAAIQNKIEFNLPNNGGHRTLIALIKGQPTDSKYPRTYDKIKKHIL